jgi:hypothetical protein
MALARGRVDAGELALTARAGFLPEMVKAVLERGLAAELTEHLGYERATRPGGVRRTRATAPPRRPWPPRSGRCRRTCRGTGGAASSPAWSPPPGDRDAGAQRFTIANHSAVAYYS